MDADTIDLADVDADERLDRDDDAPDAGSSAIDGGPDDDLDDVYADPGDVIEGDLS